MKSLRKILFWLHLISGVTAGIVILIMSVTGAILAFQPNIEAFAERAVRTVHPPENDAQRLNAKTLLEKARAAKPEIKPSNLTIQSDPKAAAALSLGREGTIYINPYTGEISGESSKSVRGFFQVVTDWHRWLGASDEYRATGRAITGVCNVAFLLLALTGIYLWFPRRLTWQHFKPITFFKWDVKGKARDFNWHNVAGIWSSLILIVLTTTAVVISYQWANNLLYILTGNEPPPAQQQQALKPENAQQQQPPAFPENLDMLWTRAEQQSPDWKSINLRLPIPTNGSANFTIDEGKSLNIFGRSQLTIDAKTAEVVKWEPYAEQNAGRQLRSWFRFTHTGQSFGIVGQIIAFLACLGGTLLVCTGFLLALRRFKGWRAKNVSK